jgi:hypothetical protein
MLYVAVYKIAYTVSLSEPKSLVTGMFMEKSCLIVLLHYVYLSFITFLCVSTKVESSARCYTVSFPYNDAKPDYTLNSFIAWFSKLAVKLWFQTGLTGLQEEQTSVCSEGTFQGESKVLDTLLEGISQDCMQWKHLCTQRGTLIMLVAFISYLGFQNV